jgi:hypothetical protein
MCGGGTTVVGTVTVVSHEVGQGGVGCVVGRVGNSGTVIVVCPVTGTDVGTQVGVVTVVIVLGI